MSEDKNDTRFAQPLRLVEEGPRLITYPVDRRPSRAEDIIRSNFELALDTPELNVLNRISLLLKYNRNLDQEFVDKLPLMRLPIKMELFHQHSDGKIREPHLRLLLVFPAIKEDKSGKHAEDKNGKYIFPKFNGYNFPVFVTLDVPTTYGELLGQYDCHSVVENGEKSLSKFIDEEVSKHRKEYKHAMLIFQTKNN
jgi:hypothetical protein